MLRLLFYILLLLMTFNINAQTADEVDAIVAKYPNQFSSTEQLAKRIQSDFVTDYTKARAVYTWIALNVRYDVKALSKPRKVKPIKYKTEEEFQRKMKALLDKKIDKTLRKKKGICGDYSALYKRIADMVGLKCEVNQGMAKTKKYDVGRRRITVDHAWNAVLIDGTWRLIDVTWGAGYVDEEKKKFIKKFKPIYFDTPQDFFFARHYPKKGIWHELSMDKDEFLKAPLVYYAFAEGEYEIIAPDSGVIEACLNDKVIFKILNVKSDSVIRYSLRRKGEASKVVAKKLNDGVLEFEIAIDKTIGKYLTIYVDETGIATFKVVILK